MPNLTLHSGPLDGRTISVPLPLRQRYILEDDASVEVIYESTSSTDASFISYLDDDTSGSIADDSNPFGVVLEGPPGEQGPMGLQGEKGDPGSSLRNAGVWDLSGEYGAMDVVTYSDDPWVALVPVTGTPPGSVVGQWVNIRGPQGIQGDQGIQGEQGERGEVGSPAPARQTVSATTASLPTGNHEITSVSLGRSFRVLHIQTDKAARIRLYTTSAKAVADAGRSSAIDPTGDHGLILEAITTGVLLAFDVSPQVNGSSMESPEVPDIPLTVDNLGLTGTVTVTFVYQTLE